MPWSIGSHPKFPVVDSAMWGRLSPPELAQFRSEIFELGNALGCSLLLADCTGLEGKITESELAEHAHEVALSPKFCFHKEAVVLPRDPAVIPEVVAWRDVAAKSGIRVELFEDRESALAWLLEK